MERSGYLYICECIFDILCFVSLTETKGFVEKKMGKPPYWTYYRCGRPIMHLRWTPSWVCPYCGGGIDSKQYYSTYQKEIDSNTNLEPLQGIRAGTASESSENSETVRDGVRAFWKLLFVISNVLFEILASAFDQVSSPNEPQFALIGLVMSFVAVGVCVTEFLWKARKEKLIMRRWGLIWWFYYPSSNRLYGTFAECFGIICALLQVIFSAIEYVFFCQRADNPVKFSIFPVIFALCVAWSKIINNPNEHPREGRSVVVPEELELEEFVDVV